MTERDVPEQESIARQIQSVVASYRRELTDGDATCSPAFVDRALAMLDDLSGGECSIAGGHMSRLRLPRYLVRSRDGV